MGKDEIKFNNVTMKPKMAKHPGPSVRRHQNAFFEGVVIAKKCNMTKKPDEMSGIQLRPDTRSAFIHCKPKLPLKGVQVRKTDAHFVFHSVRFIT